MREFILMTDSCCDLTEKTAADLGIVTLPLTFEIDGTTCRNWLDGRDMDISEFYRLLRAEKPASTSAVSVGDFEHAMREILGRGQDILYLAFSSALSTTYQSACIAAEDMKEEFPDRKVLTVDSLCASGGQGLLVWLCAKEMEQGKSLEEVRDYAEATKGRICHWFTVDDLNHLKRGGRVNAATAFFGTMLSIKPVLHVDDQGRLIPIRKVRGRKASLTALVDEMEKTVIEPEKQTIFITHGDCLEDAQFVADEVTRRFGITDIHINYVGPVIGNHSGPGTLALFFLGKER